MLIRIREYIRSGKLDSRVSEPAYGDAMPNSVSIMSGSSIADSNNPGASDNTIGENLSIQTNDMDLNESRTAFEQHLNDISGITEWLRNKV